MITLCIRKKFYKTPTCWNELTARQLMQVLQVFESNMQLLPAQIKLLKIITGLSWFKMMWAGPYELEDKLYLVDWLFDENTLTANLLPKYRRRYGPADNFNNLQVQEFIFCEQNYREYKEAGNIENLHRLIAILYRPAKPGYNKVRNADGDVREPFNDNLTALYARKVARWPMAVKAAVLHWYEGCRGAMVNSNPDVFSGGEGEPALYDLWSVMRGVAEKGVHGKMPDVEQMYVHVFMMELNELVAESERIKAAMNRQTATA